MGINSMALCGNMVRKHTNDIEKAMKVFTPGKIQWPTRKTFESDNKPMRCGSGPRKNLLFLVLERLALS